MASPHPVFGLPGNTNNVLWHYFKIENYRKLLKSEALWFARADKLGDPFEGSVSRLTIQARKTAFEIAPALQRGDHTVFENLLIHESVGFRMQKLTYVNCWHANEGESSAMWQLYAPTGGVAVRTTCTKLIQHTPSHSFVVGIRYANYVDEAIPDNDLTARFVFKRKSFIHENEIRAIIQEDPHTQGDLDARDQGMLIKVPLSDFIDAVFVSPGAPDSFLEEVMLITQQIGKPVHRSEIDSPAIF